MSLKDRPAVPADSAVLPSARRIVALSDLTSSVEKNRREVRKHVVFQLLAKKTTDLLIWLITVSMVMLTS